MLLQSSYTIKARTWPVWIIFSMIGIPAMLLMILDPQEKAGPYLFVAACIFSLLVLGLSKTFRIYIDNEVLIFTAYGKKRQVKWSELTSSTMGWAVEGGHTASYNWNFHSPDKKEISIPLGYYSRHDMRLLARQTISRAKNAEVSGAVQKVAEGKFPWFLL